MGIGPGSDLVLDLLYGVGRHTSVGRGAEHRLPEPGYSVG